MRFSARTATTRPRSGRGLLRCHAPSTGSLRHRGDRQYNSFAAVDFGTSSSAVAVHDARRNVPQSIDPGQAAYLRAALAWLLTQVPPAPLAQQWRDQLDILIADLAVKLPDYDIESVDGLVAELNGVAAAGRAKGTADLVLDAVCLALEQRVAECGAELAGWLAPLLLRCLDRAFTVPDLEEQQIREVVFDPDTDRREISSAFKITERNPLAIELDVQDVEAISLALKAELFEGATLEPHATGSRGRDATTDDLVAHVYYHLAVRTEEFLRTDKEAPIDPLVHLVVTYPTTTSPSHRERLNELLKYCLGLDRVETDFDEGVAAGLFFLMRDFGSQRLEFGAEAMRARARRVAESPPTWQQNMLIIDVGAGTTDIALIGLTLQDITEDGVGDPLVRGRHYLIKPEVLNSTGHRQLGGNYLTLRVFYWLKAAIIDTLVTSADPALAARREMLTGRIVAALGTDAVGALAPMVANGGADEPAPPELADVLRTNLPTHRLDDQEPLSEAFGRLWRLAEQAKIAFSAPGQDSYPVKYADLQPVLRAIDLRKVTGLPELFPLLPKEDLLVLRAGFETLAGRCCGKRRSLPGGWSGPPSKASQVTG